MFNHDCYYTYKAYLQTAYLSFAREVQYANKKHYVLYTEERKREIKYKQLSAPKKHLSSRFKKTKCLFIKSLVVTWDGIVSKACSSTYPHIMTLLLYRFHFRTAAEMDEVFRFCPPSDLSLLCPSGCRAEPPLVPGLSEMALHRGSGWA